MALEGSKGGVRFLASALCCGIVLFGCGSASRSNRSAIATTSTVVATTTLPPPKLETSSLVARAVGTSLDVFSSPDSPTPAETFPNPWFLNDDPSTPVPQVFLVDGQRPDGWVQIRLPERPNGSTGWVRSTSVQLNADPYRVDVSLAAHSVEIHHGTTVIYQGAVATGASATPTPTGLFYMRVLLQTVNPTSVYGPYAYGLSGHSDVLTTFDGGDGEIGIHGNNDASVLGQSVTHGCIRMDNAEITDLAAVLPLGTPVQISD